MCISGRSLDFPDLPITRDHQITRSRFYLLVTIRSLPYPLPLYPRSSHFGVGLIPCRFINRSQQARLPGLSRLLLLDKRKSMPYPSRFQWLVQARNRTSDNMAVEQCASRSHRKQFSAAVYKLATCYPHSSLFISFSHTP